MGLVVAFLLDTHTLLWYDREPERLHKTLLVQLQDPANTVYASAISIWELGIKYRIGKLPEAEGLINEWSQTLQQVGFLDLAFTSLHAREAALLDWTHKDPFDRALAAQARVEHLTLVTGDSAFSDLSGLKTLW